jgi:hypothetical protein
MSVDDAAPASGDVIQPDPVAQWERLQRQAVDVVGRGVDLTQPLPCEPDEYRARLLAAKLVLGAQRSALPLPRFRELESGRAERLIQLKWADGRLVRMPLGLRTGEVGADPDVDEAG